MPSLTLEPQLLSALEAELTALDVSPIVAVLPPNKPPVRAPSVGVPHIRKALRRMCAAIRTAQREQSPAHAVPPIEVRQVDRYWRFAAQPDPATECWEWTGRRFPTGYGQWTLGGRSAAHRVSHEIHNGPIPDGLWVLHRCDNPPCVNPDHLYAGTAADNAQDRERRGRGGRSHGRLQPSKVWMLLDLCAQGSGVYAAAEVAGISRMMAYPIWRGRCYRWVWEEAS